MSPMRVFMALRRIFLKKNKEFGEERLTKKISGRITLLHAADGLKEKRQSKVILEKSLD